MLLGPCRSNRMTRGRVKHPFIEKHMRTAIAATLLALVLTTPAMAQNPNIGQLLQGLTTGNQGQDQALRDAFERGYQRGRQDEARLSRPGRDRGGRNEDDRRSDGDRRDDNRSDRPYGQSGNTYSR